MVIILAFGVLLFTYGLISKLLDRTIITGPIVFTLGGIILGFSLPSQQHLGFDLKVFTILGKLALALVLFTDATHMRVRDLLTRVTIPGRLLGLAMPLVMISGTIVGLFLLGELSVWEAAILATILAPTDAGLGQIIMSSQRVPVRIREALNVEAGLNDGLAIPFLMLFIGLARDQQTLQSSTWLTYTLEQIGYGFLVGLLIGATGGWLLEQANKRGWVTISFQQLCLFTLALLSFFVADEIGGNEFISVFIAGSAAKLSFEAAQQEMVHFSEAWGHLLNFLVFFLFGMVATTTLKSAGLILWEYAFISLTLVRILPVFLSLMGTHFEFSSAMFIGWFGPRGLASIVLGLILIKEEAGIQGQPIIEEAIIVTVLLSIFLHGITAIPGISIYAWQVAKMPDDAPEKQEAQVKMSSYRTRIREQ